MKSNQPVTNKRRRPGVGRNLALMASIGLKMMLNNKLRLVATLLGVVFASVLGNQSIGTMISLIRKSSMLVRNAGADIWIVPPATELLVPGRHIALSAIQRARLHPGVKDAQPLLLASGSIKLPTGGSDGVTLVGSVAPRYLGGPWNVVSRGTPRMRGDYLVLDVADQDRLAGFGVGAEREVNGQRITIGGLTWGAQQMESPLAFAEFDLVRDLSKTDNDRATAGLVVLNPGVNPAQTRAALQKELPDLLVMTTDEFIDVLSRTILTKTPIGAVFGSLAAFGVVIGFVMVSLSVFSGVSESLREFGTLRAIGARTSDLTWLLMLQSLLYAAVGTLIGLGAFSGLAMLIRSPGLIVLVHPTMIWGTFLVMVAMCCSSALLALVRVWRIEPGMVFR
jgi:putative ABC transport system permease protein